MSALCILITSVAIDAASDGALYAETVIKGCNAKRKRNIELEWRKACIEQFGFYTTHKPTAYSYLDDLAVVCTITAIVYGGSMVLKRYGMGNNQPRNKKDNFLDACTSIHFGLAGGLLYHFHKALHYTQITDNEGNICRTYPDFGSAGTHIKYFYLGALTLSSCTLFYFLYKLIQEESKKKEGKYCEGSYLTPQIISAT